MDSGNIVALYAKTDQGKNERQLHTSSSGYK